MTLRRDYRVLALSIALSVRNGQPAEQAPQRDQHDESDSDLHAPILTGAA